MKITPRTPQRSLTIERERSLTLIAMFTFPTSPTEKFSVGKDKVMPKKPRMPCTYKLSCHSIDLF